MKSSRKTAPAADRARSRRRTVIRSVRALSDGAQNLLFPPRCVGCGELLPPFVKTDTVFCAVCRTAWEAARAEVAARGREVGNDCLVYLVPYRSGQTTGVPERLIYHLKHQGEWRVFRFVAKGLAPRVMDRIGTLNPSGTPDEIPIGIPIGIPKGIHDRAPVLFTYPPRRRSAVNEDGFDQAARLAKALAEACGGECKSLLRRTHRLTEEQKSLDATDRQINAARAYALKAQAADTVRGRTVVLCDDLCTTGATLNRCARLLTDAGAATVLFATVARTEEKQ